MSIKFDPKFDSIAAKLAQAKSSKNNGLTSPQSVGPNSLGLKDASGISLMIVAILL